MKKSNNTIYLSTLRLSTRTLHTLKSNKIITVEDVLQLGPVKLCNIEGFGKAAFNEIINKFEKLNLDMSEYRMYQDNKNRYNQLSYPHNLLNDIFGDDYIYNDDYRIRLDEVIKTLPDEIQEIIELKYKKGLTLTQCAQIIDRAVTVASRRKNKALQLLTHDSRAKYILSDNLPLDTDNERAAAAVLSVPVIKLGLDPKIENILISNNYETIRDIIKNPYSLMNLKNLGEKGYQIIINKLELFGIDTNDVIQRINRGIKDE